MVFILNDPKGLTRLSRRRSSTWHLKTPPMYSVIRTRDSVTAGSHLKEQIVAYPRKPSGKSKERESEDNYPHWIRGTGAFCINNICAFFQPLYEFKWVSPISLTLPDWKMRTEDEQRGFMEKAVQSSGANGGQEPPVQFKSLHFKE